MSSRCSEQAAGTVKDPVCGMTVSPEKAAATTDFAGQTFYFCSQGCAAKFRENPNNYLIVDQPQPPSEQAAHSSGAAETDYICPMHPDMRQKGPGSCPKCGMALEPEVAPTSAARTEYTCPMHPEIVRSEPGNCPICGMALEPREITGEEANPELRDMTRRFWVSVALSAPMLAFMIIQFLPGHIAAHWIASRAWTLAEFALATPVVLWAGAPFFIRGWQSIKTRNLNMFTLIALGTGTAYVYSAVATFFPMLFPASMRGANGQVAV
ncbi:MAG: heavy metal-binding domain-containing protein, partial [Terriglobia bacterium]|nr:heavy metal-binding domain-containing protein [Terriglobia bacterium]